MATSPARSAEVRESWAGDPPLRGAARQRLIEAAGRCIVRDGLDSTSLSSVAGEAGVSRPTVYRYFADRHALVLATVLDAGGVLGRDLATHLRTHATADQMAVEAMLYVLRELPSRPLLRAMWQSTAIDAEMLADFTQPGVVALARQSLAGLVDAAGWNDEQAEERVEWMLRVLLSLLVAPGRERSEAGLRELLNRFLVPVLAGTDATNGAKP